MYRNERPEGTEVSLMKELLEYIAKSLVEFPEEVRVDEIEQDGELILELRVAPSDMGKVIGRQGRIARDIRTLVKSAAIRENRRVSVDIID